MSNIRYENQGMPLDSVRRKAINELNELIYNGHIELKRSDGCLCGSQDMHKLSRFDRYGLPFGTQICKKCGLISQTLSISEKSMPTFYDRIYWPLNNGTSQNPRFATDIGCDEFVGFILPELIERFKHQLNVVEIGCGQGNRLIKLRSALEADFKLTLKGCDYSSHAVNAARARGIVASQGGVEIFFGKEPADVIILSHVLEHVVDLGKFFEHLTRITHDRSIIYIEVPGVVDLKNKLEYEYDYQDYCVVAHVHNFSLTTLANLCALNGFVPLRGTEYARLVISKTGMAGVLLDKNPYQKIIDSLIESDQKHIEWKLIHKNPIRKYCSNLYKAIMGRL